MFYNAAMFLKEQSMTHPGYDVVISVFEIPKCFHKRHHIFTDILLTT